MTASVAALRLGHRPGSSRLAKENTVRVELQDQSHLGGTHSVAATRSESINDIIERMNADFQHTSSSIGRSALYGDDLDLLADVGKTRASDQGCPVVPGPAAILGVFGRMLQRTRWALYRNQGRAAKSWSEGERLSVALVLGDREALAEMGYTHAEASEAVSAVLALPPNEIDSMIGELRAVL
jgi:hypothetical protein